MHEWKRFLFHTCWWSEYSLLDVYSCIRGNYIYSCIRGTSFFQ